MNEANPDRRYLPASPIDISYFAPHATVSMRIVSGVHFFSFHPDGTMALDGIRPKRVLANSVRTAFLEVEDPASALGFLEQTGYFLWRDEVTDAKFTDQLTWPDFQLWQKLIRRVISGGFLMMVESELDEENGLWIAGDPVDADLKRLILATPERTFDWLRGTPSGISIDMMPHRVSEGQKTQLVHTLSIFTAVDAMLADYYLDNLNGIEYELCKQRDCHNLFVANPARGKKFCSQACAHLTSMRDSRANNPKPKKKAKKRSGRKNGK